MREPAIVLVHGAWHGGWCYRRVADLLRDSGHRVRISALVYLDAFLPTAGRSFHDILPAEVAHAQAQSASASNGLSVPPIPAAAFNVNEADRSWVDSLCTPHPLATLTQPIELTGSHARIGTKSYALATKNPIPLFREFARSMRNDRSCTSYELPCGHDVMIDFPNETAAIIEEATARAFAGS